MATIGPLAQAEYTRRRKAGERWVLPSVCMVIGAYETGWGTAGYYSSKRGVFNISYPGGRASGYYNAEGSRKYRAYNSYADAVADFYDLICNNSRYAAACGQNDYSEQWTIGDTNNRVATIRKYNFAQYDTYTDDAPTDQQGTASTTDSKRGLTMSAFSNLLNSLSGGSNSTAAGNTASATTSGSVAAGLLAAVAGCLAVVAVVAIVRRRRRRAALPTEY